MSQVADTYIALKDLNSVYITENFYNPYLAPKFFFDFFIHSIGCVS
jgi:hypothetical protein